MGAQWNLSSSYAVHYDHGNYGEYKFYIDLLNSAFLGDKYKEWITDTGRSSRIIIKSQYSSDFKDIDVLKKNYTYVDNVTGEQSTAILDCILS